MTAITRTLAAVAASTLALTCFSVSANDLPGKGVKVYPLKSSIAEETFQTLLVVKALEQLGYDVQPIKEVEYPTAHLALGNGDAAQGYLIDKKTADAYKVTNIAQLKDPKIAKLFDADGDGKADLTGCNPGWGCEAMIEHHLDAYKLRDTVTHQQGTYSALIADTITRYKSGKPVLYYTWTPYWVSNELKPGKDVVWLEVPFSSAPGEQKGVDTKLANGKNYGFVVNKQHILANKAWAEQNPAAAKLFAIMQLPVSDINAQNHMMSQGQGKPADIDRHVNGWIKAHQKTFDGWIQQALASAQKP